MCVGCCFFLFVVYFVCLAHSLNFSLVLFSISFWCWWMLCGRSVRRNAAASSMENFCHALHFRCVLFCLIWSHLTVSFPFFKPLISKPKRQIKWYIFGFPQNPFADNLNPKSDGNFRASFSIICLLLLYFPSYSLSLSYARILFFLLGGHVFPFCIFLSDIITQTLHFAHIWKMSNEMFLWMHKIKIESLALCVSN